MFKRLIVFLMVLLICPIASSCSFDDSSNKKYGKIDVTLKNVEAYIKSFARENVERDYSVTNGVKLSVTLTLKKNVLDILKDVKIKCMATLILKFKDLNGDILTKEWEDTELVFVFAEDAVKTGDCFSVTVSKTIVYQEMSTVYLNGCGVRLQYYNEASGRLEFGKIQESSAVV